MFVRSIVLGCAIFAGLVFSARADTVYHKEAFSIELPSDWVEVPRGAIDAFEKQIAISAPNIPKHTYDFAFQISGTDNWFTHPYILINVRRTGRVPESQLRKMAGHSVQGRIEKKDFGETVSGLQAGKIQYEEDTRVIWFSSEMDVLGVGRVFSLSAIIPTETGYINVIGYSLKDELSKYQSVFRAAINSITLSPELVYKNRWSDSLPPALRAIDWGIVISTLITIAIGAAIPLFTAARRRKG